MLPAFIYWYLSAQIFLVNGDFICKTLSCKVTSKFTIMNFDLQPFHLSLRKVFENELDKK